MGHQKQIVHRAKQTGLTEGESWIFSFFFHTWHRKGSQKWTERREPTLHPHQARLSTPGSTAQKLISPNAKIPPSRNLCWSSSQSNLSAVFDALSLKLSTSRSKADYYTIHSSLQHRHHHHRLTKENGFHLFGGADEDAVKSPLLFAQFFSRNSSSCDWTVELLAHLPIKLVFTHWSQ